MYTLKNKTGCPLRCLLEIMSHFQSHFCVHYLYIFDLLLHSEMILKSDFYLEICLETQTCTVSYTSLKWKSKWLQAYDRYDVTNQMLCVLCCQRIIQFNYWYQCIYTCLVFVIVSFLLFYYLNIWRVKLLNLSFFKDIYMFSVVKESFI